MSLIEEIAVEFGAPRSEIVRLINSAPRRYKTYEIDKRNGGKRTISQPASELKVVQRYLVDTKLALFPVHDIAAAYVLGRGIADNARRHSKSDIILKLDFKSFFPSLVPRDLELANRRLKPSPLMREDLESYYKLLFWGEGTSQPHRLSIGAPSSPLVSNIIMYKIDTDAAELAANLELTITRYADDITVSGARQSTLERFERSFGRIIEKSTSPRLEFNSSKRGLYHRGERRMVTGLVITPSGGVSMGRERKRFISALVHKFSLGLADIEMTMHAKGMLGFAIAVEPSFLITLRAKYGDSVVNAILSADVNNSAR